MNALTISSLKKSDASLFYNSKGAYRTRLVLDPTDKKTNIAARTTFISLIAFIDRFLNRLFKTERKWVTIYLDKKSHLTPVLLNINSICKRTLLQRKDVLDKTPEELRTLLQNPSILWDKKTLQELLPNAYLINLDKRTDRIKSLTAHLNTIGQSSFAYTRCSAVDGQTLKEADVEKMIQSETSKQTGKDDRRGRYACYLSHLNVIKQAKANNLDQVLILEDDVRFMPKYLETPYVQQAFKELPSDWGMLFLGHLDVETRAAQQYSDHLVQPGCPYDLHAYIVNASMYDTLINVLEKELEKTDKGSIRPIDVVIAEDLAKNSATKNRVFACKDNVAFQDAGVSSILCRFVGGNYQKEVREYNRTFHPITPCSMVKKIAGLCRRSPKAHPVPV